MSMSGRASSAAAKSARAHSKVVAWAAVIPVIVTVGVLGGAGSWGIGSAPMATAATPMCKGHMLPTVARPSARPPGT